MVLAPLGWELGMYRADVSNPHLTWETGDILRIHRCKKGPGNGAPREPGRSKTLWATPNRETGSVIGRYGRCAAADSQGVSTWGLAP